MKMDDILIRKNYVERETYIPPILDSNKVLKIKKEVFWYPVTNKYYLIKEVKEYGCEQCLKDGYSYKRSDCKHYEVLNRHQELLSWTCVGELVFEELQMKAKEKRKFKKTKNYYTITGNIH